MKFVHHVWPMPTSVTMARAQFHTREQMTGVTEHSESARASSRTWFVASALVIAASLSICPDIGLAQAGRTWTHVQTAAQNVSGGTNAVPFGAATGGGNLLVVQVSWSDGSSFSSIGDSQGNAFTPVGGEQHATSFGVRSRLYYAANLRGGGDTITTIVSGAPTYHELYVHEYAGLDPLAPLDAFAAQVGSGASFTSGALTTTTAHDLLYGITIDGNVARAGAGWTVRSTLDSNVAADADAVTPGAYAFTGSSDGGVFIAWTVAFKQAAPPVPADTTAPSAPAGLAATATASSQVSVTWSAATDPDNPASQLSYSVYRDGAKLTTTAPGVTQYLDSGLLPSTAYAYAVSASDPAGNTSALTAPVQATTLALPVPTITTFTASPSAMTAGLSATLAWNVTNATAVSLDHGIGDVTGLTAIAVQPPTTTTYTLTATNSDGTAAAQTTVVVSADTDPPTIPSNLTSPFQSVSQIDLAWSGSTDNVAVAGYKVFRDGSPIGTTTATSYSDAGLTAGASHTYAVVAFDTAGNESAKSAALSVATKSSSAPSYSTALSTSENPIWENNNWLNGRAVGLDWSDVATTPGRAFGTQSGSSGFDDSIAVLQGNWGADQSASGTVHTVNQQSGDIYEEVEILLRWAIAPHRATGYEVLFSVRATDPYVQIVRWNGPLGNFTGLNFASLQQPLAAGDVVKATIAGQLITAYVNDVPVLQASDATYADGNPGMGFFLQGPEALNTDFGFTSYTAISNSVVDAPSVPSNVQAITASSSEIDLSWSPSVGTAAPIAGYKVFRDGIEIGESASTTYADSGLLGLSTYSYTVASYDTLGNTSAQSTPVRGTTFGSAGRSWAHVQTNAQNSTTKTNTLGFDAPTSAVNLIVVQVSWSDESNFSSINDSQGNVFTPVGGEQHAASFGVRSRLYYAGNIRGGGDTITTVVTGSPAYHELYIHEYAGLDPFAPLDAFAVNVGTGATFTSGALLTTAAHDLLYGITIDGSVAHADAAWTVRSALDSNVAADADAATPGAYAFTGRSDGGAFIAWAVAFRQAR